MTRSATSAARQVTPHPGAISKRDDVTDHPGVNDVGTHPRGASKRDANHPGVDSGSSWSDAVRQNGADSRLIAKSPVRRPVGRPPSGHKWDGILGKYVPINYIV